MPTIQQQLQARVDAALRAVVPAEALSGASPEALKVVPCAHEQFGDYQFNGALPLAKAARTNPRALAQRILSEIDPADLSDPPEIAGPGFINFRLLPGFVAQSLLVALGDERLGVPPVAQPRTVVVDFSSPNTAKPMHVGHIRSTVIGDAIQRLLRFAGHKVITDNHIGDWGTQFGMLIVGYKLHLDQDHLQSDPVGEMERLYRAVQLQAWSDPSVTEKARAETALLQAGDSDNIAIWNTLRRLSQPQFDALYGRLGIRFDEQLGESFYNDRLVPVVDDLLAKGIAHESQGAVVIEFDEPPLAEKPMLIRKSDGSALYGTTDLATLQYRVERWQPDEIIYVVDARQSLHFQQLFAAARRWGYGAVQLRHVAFGTILGDDNTPIKTRSGDSVKLNDLLDEAEQRALATVTEKNPELNVTTRTQVGRVLGIGGVKYVDLSQNRTSDYVFSWEKMLADKGNTAVYLEYAYVRIRSIVRRAGEVGSDNAEIVMQEAAELQLGKFLLRFGLAIETALSDYGPNALTDYLFELAQKFSNFYDACPVLKSEEPLRSSRLALCRLTADILKQGLYLLGIDTIEQM